MYDLPHGIVRACAGVVEALDVLPDRYKQAVARAEESVGQSFDKDAVAARRALIAAVKLSIINQKDWPYDFGRHVRVAVSRRTFTKGETENLLGTGERIGIDMAKTEASHLDLLYSDLILLLLARRACRCL